MQNNFLKHASKTKKSVSEIAFDGIAASAKELGEIDTGIEYLENNFVNTYTSMIDVIYP